MRRDLGEHQVVEQFQKRVPSRKEWTVSGGGGGGGPKKVLLAVTFCLLFRTGQVNAQSPEGTWHGDREGVEFFPSGNNRAYDKPAPLNRGTCNTGITPPKLVN